MTPFLYGLVGVIVGGILLVVFAFLLIKFLLRRFLGKIVEQLKNLGQGVPPFRVTLVNEDEVDWTNAEQVEELAKQFANLGYSLIGDFSINEIPGLAMRALVDEVNNFYAVVYEHPEAGTIVDCVCNLTDGSHLTATTTPDPGLNEPEFKRNFRFEIDLNEDPSRIVELHGRLVAEVNGQNTVSTTSEKFDILFADAYAREMDWRIDQGGVSAEEVRRVAEVQNLNPLDDDAVEQVQQQWRIAISNFMDEKIRERFLRHITKMSASQWEDARDRLFIVHDFSVCDDLVERLASHVYDRYEDEDTAQNEYEKMEESLTNRFEGQPIRAAFSDVQESMIQSHRYKRIAKITGPWPADVYLEPISE